MCQRPRGRTRLLQWGRGGEAVESYGPVKWAAGELRFNGATAVRPWKDPGHLRYDHLTDAPLQWGRGGEAVESCARSRPRESVVELQWGRGGEAVERRLVARTFPFTLSFNGAAAVRPRKAKRK